MKGKADFYHMPPELSKIFILAVRQNLLAGGGRLQVVDLGNFIL